MNIHDTKFEYTGRKFTCLWSVFMDGFGHQAFTSGKEYSEVTLIDYPIHEAMNQICLVDDESDLHFCGRETSTWFKDHFTDDPKKFES